MVARALTEPDRLWRRSEVLARPCPIPPVPGVYAWYFHDIPVAVPISGCHTMHGSALLYVGISPGPPPHNGKPPSRQTLRHRIRYHYRGNAAGSTLRLTLGCLLADKLGIQLRRVGSGSRLTFADGEALLSNWMDQHAYVAWTPHPAPWEPEHALIAAWALPLNLDQNSHSPYAIQLSAVRRAARTSARELPIVEATWRPL